MAELLCGLEMLKVLELLGMSQKTQVKMKPSLQGDGGDSWAGAPVPAWQVASTSAAVTAASVANPFAVSKALLLQDHSSCQAGTACTFAGCIGT